MAEVECLIKWCDQKTVLRYCDLHMSKAKCLIKKCEQTAVLTFCEDHLKNCERDAIKYSNSVSGSPSIFFKDKKLDTISKISNSMASASHLVSPLKLKMSRIVQKKIEKRLYQVCSLTVSEIICLD